MIDVRVNAANIPLPIFLSFIPLSSFLLYCLKDEINKNIHPAIAAIAMKI